MPASNNIRPSAHFNESETAEREHYIRRPITVIRTYRGMVCNLEVTSCSLSANLDLIRCDGELISAKPETIIKITIFALPTPSVLRQFVPLLAIHMLHPPPEMYLGTFIVDPLDFFLGKIRYVLNVLEFFDTRNL